MILTCPACATRFLVPDAAFGAAPRRVRCGKCKHEWFAEPPAAAEAPSALDARAAATTDTVSTDEQDEAAEFARPELRPIPPGSNLPARRKLTARMADRFAAAVPPVVRHIGGLIGLAALTAGLSFALYGTATGRLDNAGGWMSGLFHHKTVQPLLIENVATHYDEHTDEAEAKSWALVVEGTIRNGGSDVTTVPPLLLETRDAKGQLLGMAHPSVQQTQLEGGAVTGFSATLTNVSDKVAAVTVQFGAADEKPAPAETAAEKQTEPTAQAAPAPALAPAPATEPAAAHTEPVQP